MRMLDDQTLSLLEQLISVNAQFAEDLQILLDSITSYADLHEQLHTARLQKGNAPRSLESQYQQATQQLLHMLNVMRSYQKSVGLGQGTEQMQCEALLACRKEKDLYHFKAQDWSRLLVTFEGFRHDTTDVICNYVKRINNLSTLREGDPVQFRGHAFKYDPSVFCHTLVGINHSTMAMPSTEFAVPFKSKPATASLLENGLFKTQKQVPSFRDMVASNDELHQGQPAQKKRKFGS